MVPRRRASGGCTISIAMTLAVSLLAVPAEAGERLVAAPSDNSDFVRLPYDIAQTSSSCSVQGHWEKSKFLPSKDCQSELAHFFNFDGKADPNIPFTFAAMGDSTMYRLTNEIRRIVAAKCAGRYGAILKKSKGRCGIEKYLGVKDNCTGVNNFCLTNLRLFENEICYDCSGCDSTLWSSNGRGSRECTAEYVALMYADLLPPFPQEGLATLEGGNGTGRNIMYYLAHSDSAPHYMCLVNQGFHDATNLRNYSMLGSGIQFAKHIKRYLHDLLPACQKIIWLGINACKTETLEEAVWWQHNDEIEIWNKDVLHLILTDEKLQDRVFFYDIYNWTHNNNMHQDNLHMWPSFYKQLATLLVEQFL